MTDAEPGKTHFKAMQADRAAVTPARPPHFPNISGGYELAQRRFRNWLHGMVVEESPALRALPDGLIGILIAAFDALTEGYVHPLFRHTPKRPGARTWPELRRCQLEALRYIDLAKCGAIQDDSPVKHIEEWFGVSRRALAYWRDKLSFELRELEGSTDKPWIDLSNIERARSAAALYRRWRRVDQKTP